MKIEELTAGQAVKFAARIGEENVEFDTVIQETLPRKHMALADVIRKNEKILTFHAKGLVIDLHVSPPDSAPMVFKNVTVELRKKQDDSYCYAITTLAEAKVLNRRQCYRCYIGYQSAVQCGSNRAAYDAIIKDVSASGFSVTVKGDVDFHENQVLHTVLNDTLEEICETYSFQLYGIIVRREENDNGMITYGCKLNNQVKGLDTYIMKKERLRLKKKNGV